MRRRVGWPMIVALLAAAFLLTAGIAIARYEDQLYSTQQIRDVTEQAQILAASVSAAVSFGDRAAAEEYVNALKVNPELRAAGVYDGSGKLFARFFRGSTLPAAMALSSTNWDALTSEGTLTVKVPVSAGGKTIGAVSVIATTEPAQRRLARYIGLILLVTMGALVIAVLGFSQAAISNRAEQLAQVNARLKQEMDERQKTEEALRQSHKMEAIGQLSGGIAHDFNNLIMIAKGSLGLLRKRLGPEILQPRAEQYLVSADEALDRAAALTRRILAFSRRQPLSAQAVHLGGVIADMNALIKHSVGEGVKIETVLAARWQTLCDVSQMENVILNLAINARDAMPDGGVLTIETRDVSLASAPPSVAEFVPGDYVALSVRDTGVGMSEEVLQRAFDPFFTTKPLGKGTGLGLSMTFGYVRQSNGYLAISSVPNKGTAITIYMPRIPESDT
ncbi:MAG: ATP-binding protein [Pseudomonadota bacterium]